MATAVQDTDFATTNNGQYIDLDLSVVGVSSGDLLIASGYAWALTSWSIANDSTELDNVINGTLSGEDETIRYMNSASGNADTIRVDCDSAGTGTSLIRAFGVHATGHNTTDSKEDWGSQACVFGDSSGTTTSCDINAAAGSLVFRVLWCGSSASPAITDGTSITGDGISAASYEVLSGADSDAETSWTKSVNKVAGVYMASFSAAAGGGGGPDTPQGLQWIGRGFSPQRSSSLGGELQ